MVRKPCCEKEGVNRGAWSRMEDEILFNYVRTNGEGGWRTLPKKAWLNRCGKSCRLRWKNYLRPDIKRGNISAEEEDLIIRLHKLLGNRWSLIAGRLPGRTDNEIKNHWNTILKKRSSSLEKNDDGRASNPKEYTAKTEQRVSADQSHKNKMEVIRTKAVKCSKVFIPSNVQLVQRDTTRVTITAGPEHTTEEQQQQGSYGLLMDFDINDLLISEMLERGKELIPQPLGNECYEDQLLVGDGVLELKDLFMVEATSENLMASTHDYTFQPNTDDEDVDLNALSSFLNLTDDHTWGPN